MRSLSAFGLALLCTACVSVETLRADAEAVFREHNRVAGELMLVLPELDPDATATGRLIDADRAMLEACEPLNAMAIAHREGRRASWRQRLALPSTIEACRESTAIAESMVASLSP